MPAFLSLPTITGAVLLLLVVTALLTGFRRFLGPMPSAAFRVLVLVIAAVAAGSPMFWGSSASPKVVFLVDESPSMAPYLRAIAADVSKSIKALPADVRADVCAFSEEMRPIGVGLRGGEDATIAFSVRNNGSSDFKMGLTGAFGLFPRDSGGVILVYTDGEFDAPLAQSIPQGVSLFFVPLPFADIVDAGIVSLGLPAIARSGETCSARVALRANFPAKGTLSLSGEGIKTVSLPFDLQPGRRDFVLPITFTASGIRRISATISTGAPDSIPGNDTASGMVIVSGIQRVAIVAVDEAGMAEAREWARIAGGEPVYFHPGEKIPWGDFAGAILVDLPGASFPDGLTGFVNNGGGLLVVGGKSAFDSDYARGLPGALSPLERGTGDGRPTDVVVLLDSSGSLSGRAEGTTLEKFEFAKRAALAMLMLSGNQVRFGLVSFAREANVVLPLASYDDTASRNEARTKIAALSASGGTDLAKGLEKVLDVLSSSTAEKKHVLVFHDGVTEPGAYVEAARHIGETGAKVIIVGVGEGNNETLAAIALAAGGVVQKISSSDWPRIPEILKSRMDEFRGDFIKEGQSEVEMTAAGTATLEITAPPPPLFTRNFAKAIPGATILATVGAERAPLAAVATNGLGRAAAFASSLRTGWAGGWDSPEGRAFLTKLARYAIAPARQGNAVLSVQSDGSRLLFKAEVYDEAGSPSLNRSVEARVGAATVPLHSVGPGRYEGTSLEKAPASSAVLLVDGLSIGDFPVSETVGEQWGDVVGNPFRIAALAKSLDARILDGPLKLTSTFPGWKSALPLIGFLLALLLTAELFCSLGGVTRRWQAAFTRKL
ncbi:MAG: VWA domain-containing protein [Candidatus Brocadiia bacterium]